MGDSSIDDHRGDDESRRDTSPESFFQRLLSIKNPFHLRGTVVRVPEPPETDLHHLYRRLMIGNYDKPFIIEDSLRRFLCFSLSGFVQSTMLLADPEALVSSYTRQMMGFLLLQERPTRILLIGLGGGSLVKYCHRHLQSARITAVESNAGVIALRDEFHIPPDDDRLRVVLEDGYAFLRRLKPQAEVILVDAFTRFGIAPVVATPEFIERAHRALSLDGVLVMNISCADPAWRIHADAVKAAFRGNVVNVRIGGAGNVVVLAFKTKVRALNMAHIKSVAVSLKYQLGLEFKPLLRNLSALQRRSVLRIYVR
jgi:spermidine synthase